MCQFLIPLAYRLIRPSDHRLYAPLRQAVVVQERCLNTLLRRRIFTRKYFLPACLLGRFPYTGVGIIITEDC